MASAHSGSFLVRRYRVLGALNPCFRRVLALRHRHIKLLESCGCQGETSKMLNLCSRQSLGINATVFVVQGEAPARDGGYLFLQHDELYLFGGRPSIPYKPATRVPYTGWCNNEILLKLNSSSSKWEAADGNKVQSLAWNDAQHRAAGTLTAVLLLF